MYASVEVTGWFGSAAWMASATSLTNLAYATRRASTTSAARPWSCMVRMTSLPTSHISTPCLFLSALTRATISAFTVFLYAVSLT